MRYRGKSLWPILSLILILGACGPNTFRARGTVINPLHDYRKDDPETPRPPQILVIQRKETRVQVKHTIVGPQRKPMALMFLGEFCEILPGKATRGRIVFQCLLFTNYKDELAEMKHRFTLALPDGRKISGQIRSKGSVRNHTEKISGARRVPHMIIQDRENKTMQVFTHIEEVENEFPLFSRLFRVTFEDKDLLALDTAYAELRIDGYQRRWIYRFDFTNDPETAMRWWIAHME